ncbi:cyclopropane-fatty-acyl-phospholipid synthase [Alsobacter metallidurans]|uniref:Cyclopropane-fatty-acyl-phospholipid synthase n=1 Tax=Alsobacter metallidurans TaxID=340221 RepID=A0A917IBY2_9HYPH|nr:cyclopropane-fatty-acyl-phospholipid synthase family protein [Alsobacter metallidurans]GGH33497.1 cyclopropane-fatty-acyl-phospholipid synthase [Alsobacter metallidurans]
MHLLGLIGRHLIKRGALRIALPDNTIESFGGGAPSVTMRIHDTATMYRLLANPQLALGEGYMDGRITVENGTIYDLLDVILANAEWAIPGGPLALLNDRLRVLARRAIQFNPAPRSRANVAHHYDLSDRLYELFLDDDRQYSCAYFLSPTDTLEQAQAQKKRHIAAKLLLSAGQKVLDVGSGWGGLGLYLSTLDRIDVTGLTLSEEQHRVSNARARDAGAADRVRFELRDYRAEQGRFDRIVSVGMFEHVGLNHYDAYFSKIASLLADDGVALVHTIGRADGPGATNAFIQKYIFPGGYSPALQEFLPSIQRAGLYVTDVEVLRLHYAETLKHWRERFNRNKDEIRALYDERFCRMWEFYLAGSEATFRYGGHVVFQVQLAKRVDVVPLTRDYIGAFEAAHPLPDVVAPVKSIAPISRQAAE